ncbi:MAG: NAD(P)/FAD-dependent oxidoreductase [Flavicella sp.]
MPQKKLKIIIVGGGPAGMLAAIELSKTHEVHLFEKGKTMGRKFLVAGKGGFNLTNKATSKTLIDNYKGSTHLAKALQKFDSKATREWLEKLGIPTFVGSSGRVFPKKGIKPITVLNALKKRMLQHGVYLNLEHECVDFDKSSVTFQTKNGELKVEFNRCIFALGGASWSVTGSKGDWRAMFEKNGINTLEFKAANCGIESSIIQEKLHNYFGNPLKNISVSTSEMTVKGEALISSYGLEGNAIYPLSSSIGKTLDKDKQAIIYLDLKPFQTKQDLLNKISPRTATKNYGYLFKLNKSHIALIKAFTDKENYTHPELFVKNLKRLAVPIHKLRPLEEAISSVGGIDSEELDATLSLKKIPNIYIAGEMFDWDAPTGGFLLQGCFATANLIVESILKD